VPIWSWQCACLEGEEQGMPGLSFVANRKGIPLHEKTLIIQSLDSMLYTQNYKAQCYTHDPFYILGTTAYDQYPIALHENDDFFLFREGEIFGPDLYSIESELYDLASSVFKDVSQGKKRLTNWMNKIDGDFIILIISKRHNSVVIFNDILGKLPVYFYQTTNEIIISRDLFFVSSMGHAKKLDKMAVAQYLLFGYPLGERTLLEGVSRLQPSSLIKIDGKTFDIKILNCQSLNFEGKDKNGRSIVDNAKKLASLFSQGCRRRNHPDRRNILSLSGGLDSRSIAACLHRDNIGFTGVTRLTDERKSKLDAKYAEEISKALKFDWKLFSIDPPNGVDVLRLLRMKNGSNYLAMSFIIPFFSKMQELYGTSITYWTGDGGDKVIPDLRPLRKLAHLTDFVHYMLADAGIFSLVQTMNLTLLKKDDIIQELESRILSYPEIEWSQKYVHFLICERAFKFIFEGEDRNRCYFWNATPFYSHELFKFAMTIPDEQKSNYRLYQHFLDELNVCISNIDDPDHKLPRFSKGIGVKSLRKKIISKIPLGVRKTIKYYQSRVPESKFSEIILNQINGCEAIDQYLSIDVIRRSLRDLPMIEVKTLITLTSVIETLENGESSLVRYAETPIV
jgi:asparagine synthase (glutamine-hydrolysing)